MMPLADQLPAEGEARIAAVIELVRAVPLRDIVALKQEREKAIRVGPYLHPTIWTKEAYSTESNNLDIYRRLEDLRRAIIEADELQAQLDEQRSSK